MAAMLACGPLVVLGALAGTASASPSGHIHLDTGVGIDQPQAIRVGPDGALWFASFGNNSIGRITASGVVTNYTGNGISEPDGIVVGPDGAIWFTNYGNNSIGRITTAGKVTNFTGTGIDGPIGITAGPDGALWFTNYSGSSIGRITTSATAPYIVSHSPDSGPPGTTVVINGDHLSGATAVDFNGTPATVVHDSLNRIIVTVPAGATTGYFTVTTHAGTATSGQIFTVTGANEAAHERANTRNTERLRAAATTAALLCLPVVAVSVAAGAASASDGGSRDDLHRRHGHP
jgi:hypothetical protein